MMTKHAKAPVLYSLRSSCTSPVTPAGSPQPVAWCPQICPPTLNPLCSVVVMRGLELSLPSAPHVLGPE